MKKFIAHVSVDKEDPLSFGGSLDPDIRIRMRTIFSLTEVCGFWLLFYSFWHSSSPFCCIVWSHSLSLFGIRISGSVPQISLKRGWNQTLHLLNFHTASYQTTLFSAFFRIYR